MPSFRLASLQVRITLLVLLAALPALALTIYTNVEERRFKAAEVREGALRLARLISVDHERLIEAARQLLVTTSADRYGRRRTLLLGALLMIGAGVVFVLTKDPLLLMAAAISGVISPSGNEIGPFLSVEQAGLAQLIPDQRRTQTFAWYNLSGSFATALCALTGGWLSQILQGNGISTLESYRMVLLGYALGGVVLLVLFLGLSQTIEVPASQMKTIAQRTLGLHRSRQVVFRLSALFSLDAFAGGLIIHGRARRASPAARRQSTIHLEGTARSRR